MHLLDCQNWLWLLGLDTAHKHQTFWANCFTLWKIKILSLLHGFQVFQCVTGTCGYFYHPRCVAKALKFKMGDKTKDLEREIAAGKTFVCPIHTCFACKEPEPEDKTDSQLQFAVCRRCPTAYHRKCLPRYSSILWNLGSFLLNMSFMSVSVCVFIHSAVFVSSGVF